MEENKKNAKSPDEQLAEDMNNGYLTPDEKAIDTTYLDPISYFGEDKKLKRTGFGVTLQLKKLGELIFRFENEGKTGSDGNLIQSLSDEELDKMEKEFKSFFKNTITPLTADEVKDYGITEFIYVRRAIHMRQARANGITPEEFLKQEKEDNELGRRAGIAEQTMMLTAMEKGDMDFIKKAIEAVKTIRE